MKIKIVILITLIILTVASVSIACTSDGSIMFRVLIQPLEINLTKLEELYPLRTPYRSAGRVAEMESHYDKRASVGIVVYEDFPSLISIK